MKKQDFLPSHLSLIFRTLLVVFLVETAVMLFLQEEPRRAILDAFFLTILTAPFLAFLITKNMQAQNALQKAHRRLSVLYTIDRKASQSLDLNEILNAARDATLNALQIEAGGIFLLEPDGETMTLRTQCGFSEEFVNNVRQIKLGEGVSGKAAADKKPVVLDVSEYPTERLAPFIIREGLKTLASTPLIAGGKLIGALNLGTRRSYAFPPEEIELLTSVGQQLGIVMQNALLYEKVQQELTECKRMEEALCRAKDELETRVLERTAELTKANEALQSEIDERMRMEAELHVIVSQLTVLLESLPIGIIFEDDAHRIAMSNSAFCRMMGYSALPHELIGAECRKAAEKDKVFYREPEKFVQRIEELIRERRIVANEELSLADGRTFERDYIPIFIGKEPYRHLWLYRDITERTRMEEELRRAKDELETRVLERTANLAKVNRALKESEERFRSVVESAINAVIVADIDGTIISWNKSAEKTFLYAEKEISGKPLTILMPERYRNAHLAGLKHLISTGECTVIGKIVEMYGLRKDGTEFPIEISLGTWKTEKGIFFSGIIHDITERKRAEEALSWEAGNNASLAELSTALLSQASIDDISSVMLEHAKRLTGSKFGYVGYIDLHTGYLISPTLTRDIWNACNVNDKTIIFKKFTGLWGWVLNNRKPLLSNTLANDARSSGTPEGHVPIHRFISAPAMVGETLVGQISLANADHDYTEQDLKLVERLATIYAIALQRKQIEGALEIALNNWQNTFNAISDSVFILDPEGRIIQSNGVFERMTGMNTEDMVGQYCYKIIHGTSDFIDDCPFEWLKQNRMRESFEFEDKERGLVLQVTCDPVLNESGEITNVVHIMRDVTELKKAEETRFENVQLVLANKAKSDFLAHMSHELRTPLSSIIGFSELMQGNVAGKLTEKQRHYVDNIIASGKHLLALINDILDLSKVEAGKIDLTIEKISVPETIDEALTFVKEKAMKHNVTIKKDIDDLEIEADKQRVKQILFNLLSNAVKFSKPEGGVITITAKKEEDMAKISVSDTGIGIKEDDMKKLFGEFEQLHTGISKKYGGTGLGLSISKKLVELHGGKIWAESKHGEGSTFTFIMPLKAEKQGENK